MGQLTSNCYIIQSDIIVLVLAALCVTYPSLETVSFIRVSRVSPVPCPFKQQARGLLTPIEKVNMNTDYDQFFGSVITKIKYWNHFAQATYFLSILTVKWHFSRRQIRILQLTFENNDFHAIMTVGLREKHQV